MEIIPQQKLQSLHFRGGPGELLISSPGWKPTPKVFRKASENAKFIQIRDAEKHLQDDRVLGGWWLVVPSQKHAGHLALIIPEYG